jgi:hypothetical protein
MLLRVQSIGDSLMGEWTPAIPRKERDSSVQKYFSMKKKKLRVVLVIAV